MHDKIPFDLDDLRSPPVDLNSLQPTLARKPPRHRNGERFLKGPIPWPWLLRAMSLPGKALHVAVVLWKEAGCCKKATVRFRTGSLREQGISEDTARRGLRALAKAGLVSISSPPGRALEVTILEAPADVQGQ
jgi:hypothetical protein